MHIISRCKHHLSSLGGSGLRGTGLGLGCPAALQTLREVRLRLSSKSWIGEAHGEAFLGKPLLQTADVLLVACLHNAMDGDGADVFAGEGAVMGDVAHAGAFFGNHRGEAGKPSGPVADDGREAAKGARRQPARVR